jgi:hypothetical protein
MVLLLILIISLYVKINFLLENKSYSFEIALALPFLLVSVAGCTAIYFKYLTKLEDSHHSTFIKMLLLLIIVAVSLFSAVAILSLYLQNPSQK